MTTLAQIIRRATRWRCACGAIFHSAADLDAHQARTTPKETHA